MSEKVTPKRKPPIRREASPDDPIYKRGFVVGGKKIKKRSLKPHVKGEGKSES